MRLRLAILIAGLTSFISVSMEIMWIEIISYISRGHAGIFGAVLGLVLTGIALGARYGYKKSKDQGSPGTNLLSELLVLGATINFFGLIVILLWIKVHDAFIALLFIQVVVVSYYLGAIFPVLCKLAVGNKEESVGQETSWIYAGNIIGSTAGPLFTGYVLMDNLSPQITICIMSGAALLLALIINIGNVKDIKKRLKDSIFIVVLILFIPLGYWLVLSKMMERFHFLSSFSEWTTFRYQEHSRQGIITVLPRPKGADVFFGGGAYDGDVNTDPENNVNGIARCYMIGSMHRKPSKVLMIGLSTGSWAQVLANYKLIDSLTIIEIQPGYIDLIKKYDEISPLLSNSKVKIIIDDGRRWMRRNQNKKFDFIVMNTTFHWREHSTNLLSIEFLRMAKSHLNENGVMYWNTTGSKDVMFTAANAFDYVTSVANFVAASDSPFDMNKAERERNYPYFFRNSEPAFEKNDSTRVIRNKLINTKLPVLKDSLLKQNLWLITEDNMASEYKSGLWNRIIKIKNSF